MLHLPKIVATFVAHKNVWPTDLQNVTWRRHKNLDLYYFSRLEMLHIDTGDGECRVLARCGSNTIRSIMLGFVNGA